MKSILIALSVVAGTVLGAAACSSGSPPLAQTDSPSSSPTVSQAELDAVHQWANVWGLPVTRALQNEMKSDSFDTVIKDGTLALNDASAGHAPESDIQAIYVQTINDYITAAQYYQGQDYNTGGRYYEYAGKDYVQFLILLDNQYGMNLSGAGNP